MSNNVISIKLNLPENIGGKEIYKEKTFVAAAPKGRQVRQALQIVEQLKLVEEDTGVSTSMLDEIIQYIVDLFGNKFTIDDVYDGLNAKEIMPEITKCLNAVMEEFAGKTPKNVQPGK